MSNEANKYTLSIAIIAGETKVDYKKLFGSINKQSLAKQDKIQIVVMHESDEDESKIAKRAKNIPLVFVRDAAALVEAIDGSYICYSNGVDRWDAKALDILCNYLDNNQDIQCAVGSLITVNQGSHIKIKDPNCVVNIDDNPEMTQINPRLMVFRRELMNSIPRFANMQEIDELVTALEIILKAKAYALIPRAILWCKSRNRVATTTVNELEKLSALAEEICGDINDYTRHFTLSVIYELITNMASKALVTKALASIPDRIIAASNLGKKTAEIAWDRKLYAYVLKNGEDAIKNIKLDEDGCIRLDGVVAFNVAQHCLIQLKILELDAKKGTMTLDGLAQTAFIDQEAEIFIRDENGKMYPVELQPCKLGDIVGCDGEAVKTGDRFYIELPLHFGMKMEFVMKYSRTQQIHTCQFFKGNFIKLHPIYTRSYYVNKPYLVQIKGGTITITRNNPFKHFIKEISYMAELIANGHGKKTIFRLAYWTCRLFGARKPIWIINDRPHNAGDNGEVLFTYLMKSPLAKTHDIYFVLSNKSPDYERMKSVGPVLDYYSFQHKLKFLLADKVISSIGNELLTNPFGGSRKIYYDLYKADIVYLRHGVSHNDQSAWLNKFQRNYRLINSSSKREYESLIAGNYLYTEKQAILCGLPRFDNLVSDNKNKILFLPTWRKGLQGEKLADTEERQYSMEFVDSDFFKFYNRLINDERLLEVMRKKNFTGDFYLHPVMSAQIGDFQSNDLIKVHSEIANYQKAFKESNIMVTDYSSVAFDFAYLKKPVVYAQFDIDKFYEEHSWDRGYFSYEEDAFGHVPHDYETTLNIIINYINNDCVMEPEYVKRVDDFFAYTDRNNCKRIVEAITQLERN